MLGFAPLSTVPLSALPGRAVAAVVVPPSYFPTYSFTAAAPERTSFVPVLTFQTSHRAPAPERTSFTAIIEDEA